ncbi:IS3 family transposase [Neisseria mucosa]|uniref:IS3 family transposase n=1 Tax=Neisseria mucosa TaxID=488 RepID=UPI003557180F
MSWWEFRGFWGILQRSQIDDYMDYYNRERCSLKLKKLSPVAYRTQLTQSA